MDVSVYCCADGALLLVPACCLPSMEARQLFGPLRLVGHVQLDESTAFRDRFGALEQYAFALIDDATGIEEVLAVPTFQNVFADIAALATSVDRPHVPYAGSH